MRLTGGEGIPMRALPVSPGVTGEHRALALYEAARHCRRVATRTAVSPPIRRNL